MRERLAFISKPYTETIKQNKKKETMNLKLIASSDGDRKLIYFWSYNPIDFNPAPPTPWGY